MGMIEEVFKHDQPPARWRLEVDFQGKRSHTRPYPGFIKFLEQPRIWTLSQVQNNAFWCLDNRYSDSFRAGRGCGKLISGNLVNRTGIIKCPHCGRNWRSEFLTGEQLFVLTNVKWTDALIHQFRFTADSDCDIVIKFHRLDPRLHRHDPNKPRRHREFAILRKYRIEQDLANVRSINAIFKDFLEM